MKVSNKQYDKISSSFFEADKAAALELADSKMLNLWREEGNALIADTDNVSESVMASKFGWSFNSVKHVKIAQDIITKNSFGLTLDDSSVIEFISLKNASPVSIFAYGLGYETFLTTPGVMGNTLVHSANVQKFKDMSIAIQTRTDRKRMTKLVNLTAGKKSNSQISRIENFYFSTASTALENKCGFLTIALPQQ